MRHTGTVKFYAANRDFGYVTTDEGRDLYFPGARVFGPTTALENGVNVEFNIVTDGQRSSAAAIVITGNAASETAYKAHQAAIAAHKAKRDVVAEAHQAAKDRHELIKANVAAYAAKRQAEAIARRNAAQPQEES